MADVQANGGSIYPFTAASVATYTKIDISSFNKLIIYWNHIGRDEFITHGGAYFGLANATNIQNSNAYASGSFVANKFITKTGSDNGWSTDTISLSDISGSYYIQMIATSGAWDTDIYYGYGWSNSIWFE